MINEYAKAFFELSIESKNLENVKESFDVFMTEFNSDFKKLLLSPKITKAQKKEVINKVLKSCDVTFIHFLSVIIDNSRVNTLDDVYEDFIKLIDNKNNVVNVDVFSNNKLDEETQTTLKTKLSNKFKNKTVVINNIIDNTLLGGYKIFHNGKQIDASLKNQLDMLKANL